MKHCAGYYVFSYMAAQLLKSSLVKWKRATNPESLLSKEQLTEYKERGVSDYDIGAIHGMSATSVLALRRKYRVGSFVKTKWTKELLL